MVCVQYCSAAGSKLLIIHLDNGFHDGCVPYCFQMALCCSFFHSLSAFTRVARHIALRMALYCLFFHSSTAFPTFHVLYCSADGSVLLVLPFVDSFHGLHAVLQSGRQQIAPSSICPQLSWRFACCIAHSSGRLQLSQCFACCITQLMAAHCSFFRLPTVFMVCVLYCSVDGGGLLILPFVNGFHEGLHAAFLSGWQQISHTSAHQWLSRRLRAILLHGWHRVACSSSHRRLLRFARCIALTMAADCVFFSRQLLSQRFSRHIA